jgi:PAS domain S-box-containing protein
MNSGTSMESQIFNHSRHMSVLSEDHLRAFVENIQVGVILIDAETHVIVDLNAKAAEMIGCHRDKILGNECHEFICPAKHGQCPITDLGMDVDNSERIMLTWDGNSIPILKTVKRIEIDGHSYLLDSFVDLRQYKAAQDALRESDERFRTIFDSSTDAIMTLEPPTWNFTSGNPATLKMFGASNLEKFIACGPGSLSPEKQPGGRASAEKALEMIETAMREGSHFFEWTHKRMTGEDFPANVLLTRVQHGGTAYLHATVRDISENKRSETALNAALSELKLINENVPMAIMLVGPDRRVQKVNSAAAGFTNHSGDEMLGLSSGEALGCLNSLDDPRGCGYGPECNACGIRLSVQKTFATGQSVRNAEHWLPFKANGIISKRCVQFSTAILDINMSENVLVCMQDITERHQANRSLQDSEARFRAVFASARDGIIKINNEGNIVLWNNAAEKIFGYKSEEMEGKNLHQIIVPGRFHDAHNKGFMNFQKTGQGAAVGQTLELVGLRKDGREIPVELSLSSVKISEEWHAVGIVRDISFRRETEKVLKESEQKYRLLSDNAADVIWILDIQTRKFTFFSPSVQKLRGYTPEEAMALPLNRTLTPESFKNAMNQLKKGLEEEKMPGIDPGRVHLLQLEEICKDGSTIFVEAKVKFIRGENGQPTGIIGSSRDVTERKNAEAKIIESEKMYRDLFDKANEGLLMMDLDGHLADVNHAFAVMHGYEVGELKQMDIGKLDVLKDKTLEDRAGIMGRINAGEVVRFEVEHYHKDGHIFPVSVTASLIHINGQNYYLAFHQDIAERRKAEVAMRESEERFRAIFENTKDGILVSNANGEFLFSNQAMSEMLGYTSEELKSLKVLDIHPQKDLPAVIEVFNKAVGNEIKLAHDLPMLRKDGSVINVNISGNNIKLKGETCLVGVFRDISERKRAAEELLAAKSFLDNVINTIADPVFVKDDRRKFVLVNDSLCNIVGRPRDALLGEDGDDMFPEEQVQVFQEMDKAVLDTGVENVNEESLSNLSSGGKSTIVTRKTLYIDPAGKRYLVGVIRDITERKKVEDALQKSETKYRLLVDTANEAIIVAQDGMLKFFNRMAVELLEGYTEQEIAATPFPAFIHPDDREMVVENYKRRMKSEEVESRYNFRVITRAGAVKWVEISAILIDWEGKPATLNFLSDITERRKMELALSRIMNRLELKNKELEDYTYTVSHDLKAPLVTIQGFSDLLRQSYGEKLDDKGRHYIDRINQGSERLNRLISDLLELSRAGRKLKPFEWHDFNAILKGSLESLEGKIVQGKVKVSHPHDFPKIYGDDMRLAQVVNNLVGNAVNYMGDQKSPEIGIGWRDSGDYYEFWIQDNGIGIKSEDQGRIFNIFERASEQGAEGSGIGLSIVKKIVETHGGEIRVESVFGEGSKFMFTVPKTGVQE